jgi:hypothetical protein
MKDEALLILCLYLYECVFERKKKRKESSRESSRVENMFRIAYMRALEKLEVGVYRNSSPVQ